MKKILIIMLFWSGLNAQEDRIHEKNEYFLPISKVYTDKELIKLDTNLNELWNAFYTHSLILMEKQKEWVEIKNRCKDKVCIKEAYKKRILYLKESLDNQKTYPKEVLNGIADSLDMQKSKYYYTPGIKESKSKEFLNAFFTFKMIFKKPLIKNVLYSDKKLKEYLGDCYSFRFDKSLRDIGYRGFRYNLDEDNKFFVFSLFKINANNKPYYVLKKGKDNANEFGVIYPLNLKYCKYVKDIEFPKDIKDGRFDDIEFYPDKCKNLNKTDCELSKHRENYIPWTNIKYIIEYRNNDYLLQAPWNETRDISIFIKKILDKNNKFSKTYLFSITYTKEVKNGDR